jgi:hypothetical protein
MGKEILLKNFVKQPLFPSKNRSEFGVVRMHEFKTCEIPLLRRSDSTIRPLDLGSWIDGLPMGGKPRGLRLL